MDPLPYPFPLPRDGGPALDLGEMIRLVLGDGLTEGLPFCAGLNLEVLFDRMEGVR